MPLVPMRKILRAAHEQKYAVGGFNVFNFETLVAVIEVAEETKSPVVIGLSERLFHFVNADLLAHAMVRAAEKAAVPVAVHLDHGQSYEGIMKAIRWGFSSVMYDGSKLPFEENAARLRNVSRIAHALDVSVEGEIGYGPEYDFDKIAELAERTKIDALGLDTDLPHISIEFIGKADDRTGIPLVMHGGKRDRHNPAFYRPYIDAGVNKVNVATDMSSVAARTLKTQLPQNENANYITLMNEVKRAVKESVTKYMLAFGCVSKAVNNLK
ncbi:MAG: class II fructose-bisphosphate aldolase [Acidaminococcales bacterium]|nr:class II fructose-bisphosphate aldolase [Acidaminococcales bacterium]